MLSTDFVDKSLKTSVIRTGGAFCVAAALLSLGGCQVQVTNNPNLDADVSVQAPDSGGGGDKDATCSPFFPSACQGQGADVSGGETQGEMDSSDSDPDVEEGDGSEAGVDAGDGRDGDAVDGGDEADGDDGADTSEDG